LPLRDNLHLDALPLHRPATALLALLHCHPRYNLYFRIMVVEGRNIVYIDYMFIFNYTRLYMLEDGGL
jgi:hypothetical protein